ncbi:hypothetical protein O3P69_000720 [Scylla paramamosain]|uniref:Uncharacterized protein n=1 Tax=Scylla paramamosain TaxID=85552 RepID=A0AAW0US48_SCYPA
MVFLGLAQRRGSRRAGKVLAAALLRTASTWTEVEASEEAAARRAAWAGTTLKHPRGAPRDMTPLKKYHPVMGDQEILCVFLAVYCAARRPGRCTRKSPAAAGPIENYPGAAPLPSEARRVMRGRPLPRSPELSGPRGEAETPTLRGGGTSSRVLSSQLVTLARRA